MSVLEQHRDFDFFHEALEQPLELRAAFIEQRHVGNPELIGRLRRLLEAHQRAELAKDETVVMAHIPEVVRPPEWIGPYRVLEVIGEGGMGVVYAAEQTEPIRRRVAVKVIKLGMDTKEVIARFEAERQALALMNHPNIARILDAGATEQGKPYFVMEHVAGIPIVEFCDIKRLGIRDRLRLFVQVCHAVQHAHQKGVIHRDLKPSNMLIAEDNLQAVPKVIDFGLAKATNRTLSELSVHTKVGHMLGTPEYMSPEQATLSALDVDTRSDVYSLGVVLYELLSASRPFELSAKNIEEFQRLIVETDPAPPSASVKKLGNRAKFAARNRATNEAALNRKLRGELDWIALRALKNDRQRRYQTALALADDLERYLKDEPVKAGPPSTMYRLSKFARRHVFAVGSGISMLAFALALGAFHTTQLAQERDRADREAQRATAEAATAEQVTEFLVELFDVADPGEARGNSITAREILDKGAERITRELRNQPETQARIKEAIGRVHLNLGLYREAERLLQDALVLRRRAHGSSRRPDIVRNLNLLAEAIFSRGDYERAEEVMQESLSLSRSVFGRAHKNVAECLNNLGAVLWAIGDNAGAAIYYREALELRRELLGINDPAVTESMNNLAVLLHIMGEYAEAEKLYRETLTLRERVLGGDHPLTINSMNNLGALLRMTGEYEESESLLDNALSLRQKVYGEEHPEVAESLAELALTFQAGGRHNEAEPMLRQALAMRKKLLHDQHPLVARTLGRLAWLLTENGNAEGAVPLFEEAIDTLGKSLESNHWRIARIRSDFGECLVRLARYDVAEEWLLDAVNDLQKGLGPEHVDSRRAVARLVDLYETWGKPNEADKFRHR